MKSTQKKLINQLEKYSAVFTQLGLVVALFIVFVSLEYKTEQEKIISATGDNLIETPYQLADNIPIIVVKEIFESKVVNNKEKNVFIEKIIPVKDLEIETVIDVKQPEESDVNFIDKIEVLDDPIDLIDDEVPFLVIEEAPVFNGCENLSKKATKKCFTKKITQFIQRNFNTELAQDLGLKKGKHKIYTQFLIDKTGFITEIKIRAPHKRLEKEASRIVKKIPRFAPGKQRGRPVKVRYTLPISFMVE